MPIRAHHAESGHRQRRSVAQWSGSPKRERRNPKSVEEINAAARNAKRTRGGPLPPPRLQYQSPRFSDRAHTDATDRDQSPHLPAPSYANPAARRVPRAVRGTSRVHYTHTCAGNDPRARIRRACAHVLNSNTHAHPIDAHTLSYEAERVPLPTIHPTAVCANFAFAFAFASPTYDVSVVPSIYSSLACDPAQVQVYVHGLASFTRCTSSPSIPALPRKESSASGCLVF
ncbi:hypothetical protein C8R44DRAFT_867313 [Mycena epipterygia]|nr:hypothetical protein C8R44DRAFT_867313 [Mycena epipterygia]